MRELEYILLSAYLAEDGQCSLTSQESSTRGVHKPQETVTKERLRVQTPKFCANNLNFAEADREVSSTTIFVVPGSARSVSKPFPCISYLVVPNCTVSRSRADTLCFAHLAASWCSRSFSMKYWKSLKVQISVIRVQGSRTPLHPPLTLRL